MSTYEQVLHEAHECGASRASDSAWMAAFCRSVLPHLVGAVSPRLVWEGAQASGLDTRALATLAATDPHAVVDLQWMTS